MDERKRACYLDWAASDLILDALDDLVDPFTEKTFDFEAVCGLGEGDTEKCEGSPHQSQVTSVDADDGIGDMAIGDSDGILRRGILKRWLYLSNEPAHSSLDVFTDLIRSDASVIKSFLESTSGGVIDKNTSCLDT